MKLGSLLFLLFSAIHLAEAAPIVYPKVRAGGPAIVEREHVREVHQSFSDWPLGADWGYEAETRRRFNIVPFPSLRGGTALQVTLHPGDVAAKRYLKCYLKCCTST